MLIAFGADDTVCAIKRFKDSRPIDTSYYNAGNTDSDSSRTASEAGNLTLDLDSEMYFKFDYSVMVQHNNSLNQMHCWGKCANNLCKVNSTDFQAGNLQVAVRH